MPGDWATGSDGAADVARRGPMTSARIATDDGKPRGLAGMPPPSLHHARSATYIVASSVLRTDGSTASTRSRSERGRRSPSGQNDRSGWSRWISIARMTSLTCGSSQAMTWLDTSWRTTARSAARSAAAISLGST